MLQRLAFPCATAIVLTSIVLASSLAFAQSPNGVKTLNAPGAIRAEGTLGA